MASCTVNMSLPILRVIFVKVEEYCNAENHITHSTQFAVDRVPHGSVKLYAVTTPVLPFVY